MKYNYIKYEDLKYYIFIDELTGERFTFKINKDSIAFVKQGKRNIYFPNIEDCFAYSTILGKEFRNFKIVRDDEEIRYWENLKENASEKIKIIKVSDLENNELVNISYNVNKDSIHISSKQNCNISIE